MIEKHHETLKKYYNQLAMMFITQRKIYLNNEFLLDTFFFLKIISISEYIMSNNNDDITVTVVSGIQII